MTTRDAIRDALKAARDERDQLARQIDTLDDTIRSLENAEKTLGDSTTGQRPSAKSRNARKATGTKGKGRTSAKKPAAKKRTAKKVSADRLVRAVTELGGTATTDQVKDHLGITDGRLLTGARTQAVSQQRLTADGGTLRLTDADAKLTQGTSGATAPKSTATRG